MGIIITSIKVFDKNCYGCVTNKRQVMIAYDDPGNLDDIIDIFLTQHQAKTLANDLVTITKRNEAEVIKEKYIIKGNHPTFKYVNLTANDESDLHNKMHELLNNGYEITIELQTAKQTNIILSMEDIFDRTHKLLADGYKVTARIH